MSAAREKGSEAPGTAGADVVPPVSVVVALISGRPDDLERCLTALRSQEGAPPLEVLVPFDEPCREVTSLGDRFPEAHFLPLAGIDTSAARAGASREHHDALRTLGLRQALGEFVILTEDHAIADPRWCRELLAALHSAPVAACAGGAVDWGGESLLSYAVYLCDFGRYQNPVPAGPAAFVSDSNVCYRRQSLAAVGDAWKLKYQETIVHGAFESAGLAMLLTPGAVVRQRRSGLTWSSAVRERRVWGRSYAASRVGGAGFARRLTFAGMTPLLPFVLTWRLLDGARRKGRHVARTVAALPALFVLSVAWSIGEAAGYLTARSS